MCRSVWFVSTNRPPGKISDMPPGNPDRFTLTDATLNRTTMSPCAWRTLIAPAIRRPAMVARPIIEWSLRNSNYPTTRLPDSLFFGEVFEGEVEDLFAIVALEVHEHFQVQRKPA